MNHNTFQSNKPLVAIWSLAYNHEPYIRDCLNGFVMQQTNFPFIAIVHDDCSTDGTTQIISEYAEKYPNIIKPIYEKENQWEKSDGSLDRIAHKALFESGAKYIALCEGDDYWTDPHKLQKQVAYMLEHPDCSICFHNVYVKYDNGDITGQLVAEEGITNRKYRNIEIFEKYICHTSSMLITENILHDEKYIRIREKNIVCGDVAISTAAATIGEAYGMSDTMSVYRRNGTGISNLFESDPSITLRSRLVIGKELGGEIKEMTDTHAKIYSKYFYRDLLTGKLSKSYRIGKALWEYNPLIFIYGLLKTVQYPTVLLHRIMHKRQLV
ncbi:MAG: glycosyltransferase [Pseudoflavonifractor sp.]|nr:glycosyltransferase [Pseudoflavonifractor sp.]